MDENTEINIICSPRNPRVKAYFETLDLAVHEGKDFSRSGPGCFPTCRF